MRYNSTGFNETAITAVLDELLAPSATKDEIKRPESIRLIANYPNPFNAGTSIQIQLKQAEQISLRIYNTQGQKVRTLINSNWEAGEYTVQWQGVDDLGNDLASGVYIIQLQSGQIRDSRKAILLK